MLCLCMLKTKNEGLWHIQNPAAAHSQQWLVTVLLFQGQKKEQGSAYPDAERPKALAELTGGPGPTPADGQTFLCLLWMLVFWVGHGIRSQFIQQAWLKPCISLVPLNNQVQHFGSSDEEKFAFFFSTRQFFYLQALKPEESFPSDWIYLEAVWSHLEPGFWGEAIYLHRWFMCLQRALWPQFEAQTLSVINSGGRKKAPSFDYKKCID